MAAAYPKGEGYNERFNEFVRDESKELFKWNDQWGHRDGPSGVRMGAYDKGILVTSDGVNLHFWNETGTLIGQQQAQNDPRGTNPYMYHF